MNILVKKINENFKWKLTLVGTNKGNIRICITPENKTIREKLKSERPKFTTNALNKGQWTVEGEALLNVPNNSEVGIVLRQLIAYSTFEKLKRN